MATIHPTYGLYQTPLSTIEHTAMASWSGFVYQGLCALYHTLVLLQNDWEGSLDKFLSLEAYEDFAILDSQKKIESFHQCKCYTANADFTDECKKMYDKENYWRNNKQMLSDRYDKMYFHSNQNCKLACGVVAYPFGPGETKCGPFEIYIKTEKLVQNIIINRRLPGSSEYKLSKLISIISQRVSYIHKESINNPGNSFAEAVNNPIEIKTIADILTTSQEMYKIEERIETCRHYMIIALSCRVLSKPGIDKKKNDGFYIKS